MFVWALRDKGSEWRTIRRFLDVGKLPFIPLIEAVREPYQPQRGGTPRDPLTVLAELGEKVRSVTSSGRVWVDLGHLVGLFSANDVARFHELVRSNAGLLTQNVTPVVRTSSPGPIVEASLRWAHQEGSGICIRVEGPTHLREKAGIVASLAAASGLKDSELDLIFDAQDLPRALSYEELELTLPLTQTARSWSVVAGRFPASITHLSPDDYVHRLDRDEWTAWNDEIAHGRLHRQPDYGDYATQPAIYSPSPAYAGSPSVRYTIGEQYVVLRGRGSASGRKLDYGQYVGHAIYLRQQDYFGEVCRTAGDEYVDRIASRELNTGTPMTWRIASFDRHISVVAAQVARVSRT